MQMFLIWVLPRPGFSEWVQFLSPCKVRLLSGGCTLFKRLCFAMRPLTVSPDRGMPVQSTLSVTSGDIHLIEALPPLVARAFYGSAMKCHLTMRDIWLVSPRSRLDVTAWLDFYYDIWVHFVILLVGELV
jgi:hypothetical protein